MRDNTLHEAEYLKVSGVTHIVSDSHDLSPDDFRLVYKWYCYHLRRFLGCRLMARPVGWSANKGGGFRSSRGYQELADTWGRVVWRKALRARLWEKVGPTFLPALAQQVATVGPNAADWGQGWDLWEGMFRKHMREVPPPIKHMSKAA